MSKKENKYKISEDEFISALTINEQEFNQKRQEFKKKGIERILDKNLKEYTNQISDFIISNYNFPNNIFIILNNVEVLSKSDTINISNLNVNGNFNIFFLNCKIPKIRIFSNTKNEIYFNSIWIQNSIIDEITLSNFNLSKFQLRNSECYHLCAEGGTTIRNLNCLNSSKISNFRILGSRIKDINIANSEVSIFCGGGRIGNISFSSSKLKGLYIEQSLLGDIGFRNCEVGNISLQELTVIKSISLFNSTANDFSYFGETIVDLKIINSKIGKINYSVPSRSNELEIIDSTIEEIAIHSSSFNNISIKKSSFQEILFNNCFFIKSYFYLVKCNITNFEDCKFYELKANSSISKDSFLIFANSNFFYINISYFSSTLGFIFFKEVKPISYDELINHKQKVLKSHLDYKYQDLLFEGKDNDFRSGYINNTFTIRNILLDELLNKYQKPVFILHQSSLGKAEFTDCDLKSFDFQFSNSKITEIFISGGTIPSDNIQIFNTQIETLEWHEQKVSIYNQLKKVFESQGDIFWSSHFQSKTSKHQSKVLELRLENESKNNDSWKDKVSKFFSTNRFDLHAFRLNQFSNLHGENWGRALAFTLFVPFPFYCLYLWSIGRLFLFNNEMDWNLIGYYFSFLDPTHKIEFLEEPKDLNGFSRFLDFFSRIIASYGIYQLIVAFRKLGKKA